MTDPVQAALCLAVAAVIVLTLCLGGTLIAAGLWPWPPPRRSPSAQRTVTDESLSQQGAPA